MKKIIKAFICVVTSLFPCIVFATGGISVSKSSLQLAPGGSGSFNVCLNNAGGRVDLTSSNAGVASINPNSVFPDNGCISISVTAGNEGSAVITATVIDATTYDLERINGQTAKVSINVVKPATPVQPPSNNVPSTNNNVPSTNNNVAPSTNQRNNNSNNKQINLNGDTTLKIFEIVGYNMIKEGDIYKVQVPSDVEEITINAISSNILSRVSGVGLKKITDGANNFTVVVTAQNGATQNYNLVVERKSEYIKLSELDNYLQETTNLIKIKLSNEDVLTKNILDKIKSSKKTVELLYYNAENKLIYKWTIDGKNLVPLEDFNPIIKFDVDNKENLLQRINYVDSYIIQILTPAPKGVKLELDISSKYLPADNLFIYSYSSAGAHLLNNKKQSINANTGFLEIIPSEDLFYIVSKGNLIQNLSANLSSSTLDDVQSSNSNIFLYISIIESAIILGIVVFVLILKKQGKLILNFTKVTTNPVTSTVNNSTSNIQSLSDTTNYAQSEVIQENK